MSRFTLKLLAGLWVAGLLTGTAVALPDQATPWASLTSEIEQLKEAGKFELALPLAEQVLALQEQSLAPDHPDLAKGLLRIASLLKTLKRYAQAEPLYQRALILREKHFGLTHPEVAECLNGLAILYRVQGRYTQAEPLYLRALAIQEKVLGPNDLALAKVLNNLANLYWEQGSYLKAEKLHQRALAILEKGLGPEHPKVAVALNNLAVLYEDMGRYPESEVLHQRALSIREKNVGSAHPDVADSLHNLADLYVKQGRLAQVAPLYQRALEIRETKLGPNHLDVALSLSGLVRLYRIQGRYSQSRVLHQRALKILEQTQGIEHPDVAKSLYDLALLELAAGGLSDALGALTRSVELEERNLTLLLLTGSEQRKQDYLATLGKTTALAVSLPLQAAPRDPVAAQLALTTLLRRKGRVLDAVSNNWQTLRQNLGSQEQALIDKLNSTRAQVATLVFSGPDAGDIRAHQAEIMGLQTQAEQWETALNQRSTLFRAEFAPVTVTTVQKALPPDAALLEWVYYTPVDPKAAEPNYLGKPRYAAAILKASGSPQWVDLGEAESLDRLITQFRRDLGKPSTPIKQIQRQSRQLAQKLLQPIYPLLGNIERLLIAPDGQLNLLPFAALIDDQNRYLLDRYTISYLGSGRDLIRLQKDLPARQRPLLIVNPDFNNAAVVKETMPTLQRAGDLRQLAYTPLPGTELEGAMIQRLWPQIQLFKGSEATENILKQARGPLLVHIATHGFFLAQKPIAAPENPLLRSGLALAGFNTRTSAGEDGVLTALEVSGLDLQGTELTVLSACDTGVGEVLNGEGVYGLRRALVIAGSRSQLISLWKVDDLGTSFLMELYYQQLLAGQGRSEAFQQTQKKLLADPRYVHPYYWAAFIPSGAWQPMVFSRAGQRP